MSLEEQIRTVVREELERYDKEKNSREFARTAKSAEQLALIRKAGGMISSLDYSIGQQDQPKNSQQ